MVPLLSVMIWMSTTSELKPILLLSATLNLISQPFMPLFSNRRWKIRIVLTRMIWYRLLWIWAMLLPLITSTLILNNIPMLISMVMYSKHWSKTLRKLFTSRQRCSRCSKSWKAKEFLCLSTRILTMNMSNALWIMHTERAGKNFLTLSLSMAKSQHSLTVKIDHSALLILRALAPLVKINSNWRPTPCISLEMPDFWNLILRGFNKAKKEEFCSLVINTQQTHFILKKFLTGILSA